MFAAILPHLLELNKRPILKLFASKTLNGKIYPVQHCHKLYTTKPLELGPWNLMYAGNNVVIIDTMEKVQNYLLSAVQDLSAEGTVAEFPN